MCYTVKSIDDVRELVAAARGLAGLVDLDALVLRACRQLHGLVGEDVAAVAVCEHPDQLTVASATGMTVPATIPHTRRGEGLGWLAVELDDTPVVRLGPDGPEAMEDTPATRIDQTLLDGVRDDPLLRVAARSGVRRVVACPVGFGGATLGCLYVGRRTDQPFDARIPELLWEFAASLAPLMVTAVTAARAGEIAVAQERARIAQHLHDTAGQMLFAISLTAQDLRERAVTGDVDGGAVTGAATQIEHEAAKASAVLRQAMHTLIPPGEALPVTVRRDVAAFSRRSGIPAETIVLGTPVETSDLVDDTIVAVVREGLHNVERHARASTVSVTLTYRPLDVAVLVQDDGCGLTVVPTVIPLPGKARSLGLPGLHQRVRAAGGELSLRSGEDGGAGLLASLPLGSVAA